MQLIRAALKTDRLRRSAVQAALLTAAALLALASLWLRPPVMPDQGAVRDYGLGIAEALRAAE